MDLRYFIQKPITISKFADVLAISSMDVELDDSPSNFYPYFRLRYGKTRMIAHTNAQGHVVQLKPISCDPDGHRKIAGIIGELFDTVFEVMDFGKYETAVTWLAKFRAPDRHRYL